VSDSKTSISIEDLQALVKAALQSLPRQTGMACPVGPGEPFVNTSGFVVIAEQDGSPAMTANAAAEHLSQELPDAAREQSKREWEECLAIIDKKTTAQPVLDAFKSRNKTDAEIAKAINEIGEQHRMYGRAHVEIARLRELLLRADTTLTLIATISESRTATPELRHCGELARETLAALNAEPGETQ
jgi:hypothetical protein